jgi:hypothetical protein
MDVQTWPIDKIIMHGQIPTHSRLLARLGMDQPANSALAVCQLFGKPQCARWRQVPPLDRIGSVPASASIQPFGFTSS